MIPDCNLWSSSRAFSTVRDSHVFVDESQGQSDDSSTLIPTNDRESAVVAIEQSDGGDISSHSIQSLDGSTLSSIRDVERLETLVSELEAMKSLTSIHVRSWVHPLMLATSALHTTVGAEQTERLLAKCLQHVGDSPETTTDSELLLPYPNAEMYNLAITSWIHAPSTHGSGAKRASRLLALMEDEYTREQEWLTDYNKDRDEFQKRKRRSPKPDIINYSSLMDAWSKAGTRDSPFRAEAMLRDLERKSGVEDWLNGRQESSQSVIHRDLTPDRTCYNTVMVAWARSRHPQALAKTRELIAKLQKLFETTGDNHFAPDTRSYNNLISAIGKHHRGPPRAKIEEAEQTLKDMFHKFHHADKLGLVSQDGTILVHPNVKTYNGVIHALSTANTKKSAYRAEAILMALLGDLKDDIDMPIMGDVLPDGATFNSVINAWAKSGLDEAGEKAEKLLELMEDTSGRFGNSLNLLPDTITYNSVMNAISRGNSEASAQRAEAILNTMLENETMAYPNAMSFSTVIHAWALSQSPEAVQRAESLLTLMEQLANETGKASLRPNGACYFAALLACTRASGSPHQRDGLSSAAQRAEIILEGMMEKAGSQVNIKHCNVVLSAWSNHRHEPRKETSDNSDRPNVASKVNRARALLDRMLSSDNLPSPNTESFNYVLEACASYAPTHQLQSESLSTAVDTFNILCEQGLHEHTPDTKTYSLMMRTLRTHLPRKSKEQVKLVEDLFRHCCDNGLLTEPVLKTTAYCLPGKSLETLIGLPPTSELNVRLRDLPEEWRCNTRKQHRRRR